MDMPHCDDQEQQAISIHLFHAGQYNNVHTIIIQYFIAEVVFDLPHRDYHEQAISIHLFHGEYIYWPTIIIQYSIAEVVINS